jgi:threonine/homoserine efflux transporter RhtA
VFTSLEPVFGAGAGLVILGERLSWAQIAGVAAVITAAAGSAWSSAAPRAPSLAEAPPG